MRELSRFHLGASALQHGEPPAMLVEIRWRYGGVPHGIQRVFQARAQSSDITFGGVSHELVHDFCCRFPRIARSCFGDVPQIIDAGLWITHCQPPCGISHIRRCQGAWLIGSCEAFHPSASHSHSSPPPISTTSSPSSASPTQSIERGRSLSGSVSVSLSWSPQHIGIAVLVASAQSLISLLLERSHVSVLGHFLVLIGAKKLFDLRRDAARDDRTKDTERSAGACWR